MTKLSKIFIIISSAVIVIGLSVGIYCARSFTDCSLSSVTSINDLSKYDIKNDYIMGKDDEDRMCKHYSEEFQLYIDDYKDTPIVAIVKSTEKFRQFTNSYMQEIDVIKVMKGEEYIKKDTKVSLFEYGGFKYSDGCLIYQNCINIMKPDSEYLIFLEPSDLNKYKGKNSYSLYKSSCFSYICLERGSEMEVYNPKNTNIYNYIKLTQNTTSKKIAESIAYAEDKIIAEFIGENKY